MGKMKWLLVILVIPAMVMATNLKDVVINELMWMGSVANTADEWIELYNTTGSAISLTGWTLVRNTTVFSLSGSIPANGFFLIERAENNTDVPSDLLLTAMSLTNTGNTLKLIDGASVTIDSLSCAAPPSGPGWYAGSNTPPKYSMERREYMGPDNASNWGNNNGVIRNGHDSGGNSLNATPKAQNSVWSPGGDTTPPSLLCAYAMGPARVDVLFNEPVEPVSAEEEGNYSLDPSLLISVANQDAGNHALVHLTTGTMTVGTYYTLTVTDIADTAGNHMSDQDYSFMGNIMMIAAVKQDLSRGNFVPDLTGRRVTVHGIATSSDYNFQVTNADFYLEDATAGIDIFQYTVIPGAVVGDEMIVSGVVGQYYGNEEIMGPYLGVETLSTGNPVSPLSHIYHLSYVVTHGEQVSGFFGGIQHVMKVSGTWPPAGSDANIIITDDGGVSQMVLRIDKETNIDGSPEPVWPVDIAGILLQFDGSTPPDSGYELQPRGLMDIYPNGTLPVELVSFEGFAGNREAKLIWTTASETDNDHFYLIRATDSQNYSRVSDNIPAANSPTGSSYSYVDGNLVNGATYYYKLVDVDINGNENINGVIVSVTPSVTSSFTPDTYALHQNYPNPFNPTTTISYDVREAGFVTLKVFDILGREVMTLVNGTQEAASYSVEFNASTLSSGIYFYQLKVNDNQARLFSDLKKMVVLK